MAMGDVILSCSRTDGTNADTNLTEITYNTGAVARALKAHSIEKIYFTSSFVADRFCRHFKKAIDSYPHLELVTLPSPSPRYARMSVEEKIETYRKLLPKRK